MKKILIAFLLGIIILTGCDNTMNTPTSKVEDFLGKYQKLDKKVLTELEETLKKDDSMNEEQRKEYQILLEKQYQNLSYKIKNEEIEGDTATVDVEVEVLDYQTSINKSKEYYAEHKDEFKDGDKKDEEDNSNETVKEKVEEAADDVKDEAKDKIDNIASFIDYKIKELKTVNEKIKYDLTFNLTKENGEWVIDDLNDEDRQKLHGLY
ncbi:MAG: hypothetical protein HFE81_04120 [Bacilli bacterium]|nr:hypothetical protein [Bacilli bacterium]